MRMLQGKVLDGRIVVDDELPEGASVTVLLAEAPLELGPEDDAELAERLAEAKRGEMVEYGSIDEMLHDLCQ